MFKDASLRQSIHETLKSFPDLHRISKKFLKGKANLGDVVRVYQVVIQLPLLISELNEYTGVHTASLNEQFVLLLKEFSGTLESFKEMTETTIDLDAMENHEFHIKANFDEDLKGSP